MKKFFITSFILLTLLALTTGSALADGVVTGMKVSRSGGLTFTFTVTGYLSPSQLNGGYVQVQGGDAFVLHCVQTDEFTVVCHAPAKIDAGVAVALGGSTFWVEKDDMPPFYTGSPQAPQYCYGVYNYPTLEQFITQGINQWVSQGTYCQDAPAAQWDELEFDGAYWESTWYYFEEEGWEWYEDVPATNPGAAYYIAY